MYTKTMTCLLAIFATHLTLVYGQFGGPFFPNPAGGQFFQNSGGSSGGFSNQNTNFQQNRGGSFGVIAAIGSGGSSTNFQQQNSNGGFSNFGANRFGGFRAENGVEDIDEDERELSRFRYASPYDLPKYAPKPKPAPAYHAPPPAYNSPAPQPIQCPQNLLVGCAPRVQYVPCSPPSPSYGHY